MSRYAPALVHSTITETFDRYGHLFPGARDDARARMDAYLEAELARERQRDAAHRRPRPDVAATLPAMTLHAKNRVGVRELHDRLSEYLDRVEGGSEVVVTRRGRPIAVLSGVESNDALEDLVKRGLVTVPTASRRRKRPRVKARGSVSELVAGQRR